MSLKRINPSFGRIKFMKIVASTPKVSPNLTNLETQIFNHIKKVCENIPFLSNGKYQVTIARVAGGWVRDKLMPFVRPDVDVDPPKDLDITINNMNGGEFCGFLQLYDKISGNNVFSFGADRGETANRVGVCFGQIYGQDVEFLQLRKESYEKEGDRQSIEIDVGSLEEDTYRRDLTINSMYYNINTGEIEDITGQGYNDLATLTLRTPCKPNKNANDEVYRIFLEDPVRVLRILRFYSRWPNSTIAKETLNGMYNPKIQELLIKKTWNQSLTAEDAGVPPEKVSEELKKIMKGKQPEESIRIMFQTGILHKMLNLPKQFHPLEMDQLNRHHQMSVIEHSLKVLENTNKLSEKFGLDSEQKSRMNLSALFHDFGKLDPRSHKTKPDGTRGYMGDDSRPDSLTHQQSSADIWNIFATSLKMSDADKNFVHDLVLNHMNPHAHVEDFGIPTDKQLRKYLRKNPSWTFQYIHAMADAMSKGPESDEGKAEPYKQNLERLRLLAPTANNFGDIPPQPDILNGQEIMQIVGLPAKPPIGLKGYIEIVKERIREEQDENPNLTKDDAIKVVQKMMQSGELKDYYV